MTAFTEEDVEACWEYGTEYGTEYLVQILNGEYPVESAREDLKSLIGSKWDKRVTNNLGFVDNQFGEGC